ncbi:MAG: TPM domain-containing protein [Bacteroidota bacterium]
MKKVLVLIYLCLVSVAGFSQQRAVPPQGGYMIHDDANVLSQQDKAMLEYLVKAEADSTSNQIAVLIIKSLDGDDIDSYAIRVAKEWKLGQDNRDNGVLFLVAIEDRKMRIEVGRGLEGVLTDAQSSRIDRNNVAPYFRQGDYSSGVKAGVVSIIQTIKGEYKNDLPHKRQKKPFNWVYLVVLLIFIIFSSRRGGGGGRGGYMSRGGWFLPLGGGGGSGGGGFGGSSGSWGGGGSFGGGGSSDSW